VYHNNNAPFVTYTNPLLAEFLAGIWLGKVFGVGLNNFSAKQTLAYVAIVLVVISALAFGFDRLMFGAVAVALISSGLLIERFGFLPKIRLIKLLGDASFAIYLFQEFAFKGVEFAFASPIAMWAKTYGQGPQQMISIVAAIAFGVVVFWTIERPVTRLTRRALSRLAHTPVRIAEAA